MKFTLKLFILKAPAGFLPGLGALCLALAGCSTGQPSGNQTAQFAPLTAEGATNSSAVTPPARDSATVTNTAIKNELTPDLLQPDMTPFTLGPGDVIEI